MPADSAQKERIRKTAARLFAKQGYHGTGVEQLSRAVGLGRGALYHHIGSKDALMYEISTRYGWEMIAFGESLIADDGLSAEEKVRSLGRALMETLSAHVAEWTVFHRDFSTVNGKIGRKIIDCRDQFEAIWIKLFAEGYENGEFREIDRLAVKGILGMFNYSYLWIRQDRELTPSQIAEMLCDLFLDGIRPA